jgi:hypothetical protein
MKSWYHERAISTLALTAFLMPPVSSIWLTWCRVSLNWPLSAQSDQSFFARKVFHQELIHKAPRIVNDDVWTFNSQVSSQWDGLRHFAYQKEERFYGGVTLKDIHGVGGGNDGKGGRTTVLGIQG